MIFKMKFDFLNVGVFCCLYFSIIPVRRKNPLARAL